MSKALLCFIALVVLSQTTYLCRSSYTSTRIIGVTQTTSYLSSNIYNSYGSYNNYNYNYNYNDRSFLTRDIFGDGSRWVYPASQSYYGVGYSASYSQTFTATYTQSVSTFRLAATGTAYVYLNDVLVQTYPAYPQINTISIRPRCGQNTIRIQVVNVVASPCAVIYSVAQAAPSGCSTGLVWNSQSCSCYSNYVAPTYNPYPYTCVAKSCYAGYSWDRSRCTCAALSGSTYLGYGYGY